MVESTLAEELKVSRTPIRSALKKLSYEELVTKSTIYLIVYDEFYTKPLEELNSMEEHKQIYEALKSRNSEKSAEVMSLHIKSIFENLGITKIRL